MKFFKKTAVTPKDTDKAMEDDPMKQVLYPDHDKLGPDLEETLGRIRADFRNASDLVINEIQADGGKKLACIYIRQLADREIIDDLSRELTQMKTGCRPEVIAAGFDGIKGIFAAFRSNREGDNLKELYQDLLAGDAVFVLDGEDKYFAVVSNNEKGRAIEEPSSQTVIRGPKDSFTENLDTNVMLLRKKIRNKDLKVEELEVGNITHTAIRVMYIEGLAKPEILNEVKRRINAVDTDYFLCSGSLEEYLKDDRYSIFPTIMDTERPDTVAAAMLEGRVAIITDGSPFVLTAPAIFAEFFIVSEDYYHHFSVASLTRFFRIMSFFIAALTPALYIAVVIFMQELLPTPLLISIAAQREGVPFPAFLQVLLMEAVFEILREAGIRMPRTLGPAISIVGALVLGQAAVQAGLIAASVVIVVSITAISSFAIANYEMNGTVRILRFMFLIVTGIFGLYGLLMGIIMLMLHLCKLKSFSVPYLAPTFLNTGAKKDSVIRFPLWLMKYRPGYISASDRPRTSSASIVTREDRERPEMK